MEIIPKQFSDRFSGHAKNAILKAFEISKTSRNSFTGHLHLACGISEEKGSAGFALMKSLGISSEEIIEKINKLPKTKRWKVSVSPDWWDVLEKAAAAAYKFKYNYLGTEHLLSGILALENSEFKDMAARKLAPEGMQKHIKIILESSEHLPDLAKILGKTIKSAGQGQARKHAALDFFGQDLTKQAAEGKLDFIVGREKELEKVISILGRKNKNNPILIGEPGVGKTAIVHKLAQKIARNDVPETLLGKRIISLDLALLVSGTMFRGEFESRLKEVLEEVEKDESVILFIDEIHTIVGAGSASGSLDAANIMKPALTKGEIQCIGATTLDEYRKYIEKDSALERRFHPVLAKEPSAEETIEILKGIRKIYEKYHNVAISDDAIAATVEMGSRYIQGRKLPDKALDLLDEASAKAKMSQSRVSKNNLSPKLKKIELEKESLEGKKEKAVRAGDYNLAIQLRSQLKSLQSASLSLAKKQEEKTASSAPIAVERKDISNMISENTGIPVSEIFQKGDINLAKIEAILKKRIIGQDEAVSAVSRAIKRSRAGLSDPRRPIGSFIFLGPTGVGKTELAKTAAERIFKSPDSLIKIDMSEFSEKHTVSRLIGAPAGYVGFEEGGKLTEQVRRNPYSIVLFDEIEKAHPDILNILLQIMEDGRLTDASGRQVNFSNTLIIMTSNIGTSDFTEEARIGFSDKEASEKSMETMEKKYQKIKEKTIKELREELPPEILNRLSAIIVFKPLRLSEIEKIFKMESESLFDRIKKQKNIDIEIDKKAQKHLAKLAFIPNEGARAVRSVIQENIEDPISEMIISGEIKERDKIRVEFNNRIIIKKF